MALTSQELTQWVQDKIKADRLSWTAQNDVSYIRGLHHKYDQQLFDVIEQYKEKYQRLVERYKEYLDDIQGKITNFSISQADLKGELLALKDKVIRMADKYWAVRWEIEGRKLDIFKRTPVGTLYYIDLDAGNDANDGLGTGTAWLTLEKYTTVTVRSAGDIAYVRANTDQTGTQPVNFDEDGNKDNYISIIGCDSVNHDPWGDASDVKPIYDQNSGAYHLNLAGDDFWWIQRLNIKNGSEYGVKTDSIHSLYLKDCEYYQTGGLYFYRSYNIVEDGGLFTNNKALWFTCQLQCSDGSVLLLKGTRFDAGAASPSAYQLQLFRAYHVEAIDVDFAYNNAAATADIYFYLGGLGSIRTRNCNFSATPIKHDAGSYGISFHEDYDQVYAAGKALPLSGSITKQTSPITGNATQSYKMEPASGCGLYVPLTLHGDSFIDSAFTIEGTASEEITITIKMQAEVAWGTYPTNTELYIEASYYDSGANAGRSTVKSTQVISQAATWTDFTVTMTPLRDGPIYVNVYLKVYEASKSVTINGEAVTS